VAGAIAIVIVLLLFPIVMGLGGLVLAAIYGVTLNKDGEARHEGSELLDVNV
jgi:hypothetical protein